MANVTVTADIDKNNRKVILRPTGPVAAPQDTFLVQPGDALTFQLRDAQGNPAPAPPGFEVVITFVESPRGSLPPRPLLRDGNTLKTRGQALGSTVSDQAFKGHYRYQVDLVSPSEKISLACFWSTPGGPAERTGMGGGEDGGGPVNP